jgi:hypothetical protein
LIVEFNESDLVTVAVIKGMTIGVKAQNKLVVVLEYLFKRELA